MGILPLLRLGMVCALLGGCSVVGLGSGGTSSIATYDITPPQTQGAAIKRWPVQLAVRRPSAASALNTNRILVSVAGGSTSYFSGAAWSARLPELLQSRLTSAMDNSEAFRVVLKEQNHDAGDYTLATEIRAFQIDVDGGNSVASVKLTAKLINKKRGNVLATKECAARLPANKDDPDSSVGALQSAFDNVAVKMVRWTASFRSRRNRANARP
ncbi:MAG: ABC-type transport auxiliary lipoprotein family protein [Alphaproteobacteria bacterium]